MFHVPTLCLVPCFPLLYLSSWLAVYLRADPDVCYERLKKRDRKEEACVPKVKPLYPQKYFLFQKKKRGEGAKITKDYSI